MSEFNPTYFALAERPIQHVHRAVGGLPKRVLDLSLALYLLFLFSPLFLVVALAIKLCDEGPVFFSHRRIGFGRQPFRCWKFRTMVPGGDDAITRHFAENPEAAAEWAQNFKLECDPRVTPLGELLRKSSLDELPQLWNVVKGEMSLVGPRPIVDAEIGKYGRRFSKYASAKPGMTGLWQISGRNKLSYRRRVAIDTRYVQRHSLGRDLLILLRTLPVVILRTGR